MTHTISPENRELELGIQQKINECLDNFESFCFNAGAGAGKTYALQKSIEHILKTKGENLKLSNQKILCITYTNAAKDEILNRLGKNSSSVVSTIHEFLWGFISIQQGLLTVEHNNKIKEELNKIEQKINANPLSGSVDLEVFHKEISDEEFKKARKDTLQCWLHRLFFAFLAILISFVLIISLYQFFQMIYCIIFMLGSYIWNKILK